MYLQYKHYLIKRNGRFIEVISQFLFVYQNHAEVDIVWQFFYDTLTDSEMIDCHDTLVKKFEVLFE